MLMAITTQCGMHCTHCMDDAPIHGEHMTLETAEKVLKALIDKKLQNFPISITGGDPFENPNFFEILKLFDGKLFISHILTNGTKIVDDEETYQKTFAYMCTHSRTFIQVTTDKRYYPRVLTESERAKLNTIPEMIIDPVPAYLYPQGRALKNFPNDPYMEKLKCPHCTNMRLLYAQLPNPSLKEAVLRLAQTLKFCTPKIHYNGGIGLGESNLCPTIAYIWDDEDTIRRSILNNTCTNCTILHAKFKSILPDVYKIAFRAQS